MKEFSNTSSTESIEFADNDSVFVQFSPDVRTIAEVEECAMREPFAEKPFLPRAIDARKIQHINFVSLVDAHCDLAILS
jgi:hypothetical protein